MIKMNYILLKEYINKLNKEKIKEISSKNNIFFNDIELNIIYTYIKERYLDFIKNPNIIINELKDKLSKDNYLKLLNIYNQYKDCCKYKGID